MGADAADDGPALRPARRASSTGARDRACPAARAALLFAYLVVNRRRAVARDELIELLWPGARRPTPARR